MRGALADIPSSLSATVDVGFLYYVTDFHHLIEWNGAAWQFGPGDTGNGYFADFAVAPTPAAGWKLCNGTATTYLVMGVTVTTAALTPPDLNGTPAYRKSGAAYSGAIVTTGGALTGAGALDPSHITVLPYFRR